MQKLILLLGACLIAFPAAAQVGPTPGGGPGGYGGGQSFGGSGLPNKTREEQEGPQSGSKEEKPVPPPPAIPGAEPGEDAVVIPAEKPAAELSPNDALFDAITRGDLAAAKDAVNRGAQLEAHNVLGLSPLDASIDLNRNDITFLLLSLRGPVVSSKPVHTAAAKPGKPIKVAVRQAPPRVEDRGTPNPAVGFTGF